MILLQSAVRIDLVLFSLIMFVIYANKTIKNLLANDRFNHVDKFLACFYH